METQRDPDYEDIHVNQQNSQLSVIKNDAKEATIKRIQAVINAQFNREVESKEAELTLIEKNLQEAHYLLDHLRTRIITKFYLDERVENDSQGLVKQEQDSWIHPATKQYLGKAPCEPDVEFLYQDHDYSAPLTIKKEIENQSTNDNYVFKSNVTNEEEKLGSNFHKVKKSITIVVGNISKYIPPIEQSQNDQTTHKWMVYVRFKNENLDTKSIVKKVIIFLHPSYKPNDLVELKDPPFYLCRRGWGEFPVRVQIHFNDSQNKPFDIIHNLKLDKTFTGLQTLGGETVVDVSLYLPEMNTTEANPNTPIAKRAAMKTPLDSTKSDATPSNTNIPKSDAPHPNESYTEPTTIKTEFALPTTLENSTIAVSKPSATGYSVPKTQMRSLLLQKPNSKPQSISLLKNNQQTYKIIMIKQEPQSNQVKYLLCPSPVTVTKPIGIKEVKIEPGSGTNPPGYSSWKSKVQDHHNYVQKYFGKILTNYMTLNEFLLDLVKFFPLCCENSSYTFCAPSWEVFNSWNIGKQRASEWLRAKMIKRFLDELLGNHSVPWAKEKVTPKIILNFCRASGFIPPYYVPVASQSSAGPKASNEDLKTVLVNAATIVSELEESLKGRQSMLTMEEDSEVEILDEIKIESIANMKRNHEELQFLKELFIDKAVDSPEEMKELYIEICKQFMADIVRCSLLQSAATCKRTMCPSEINIDHVYQGIIKTPKFDILTNKYLGIDDEIG